MALSNPDSIGPDARPYQSRRGASTISSAKIEQTLGRIAPHNLDAERGLLAACILDGGRETLNLCAEHKLTTTSFFHPHHQILFDSLLNMFHQNAPVDEITLAEALQRRGHLQEIGGHTFINQLTDIIETTAHAPYWIEIIREKDMLRRLIRTSTETIERCYQQQDSVEVFIEKVEQSIFDISQDRITDQALHVKTPIDQASLKIQNLIDRKASSYGISTGFRDLDALTFGFHPQEMLVLAARPSVGKTSLALNFIEAAVFPQDSERKPVPTLLFSLEMSADQLAMRLLCSRARVDLKRVRDGFCSRQQQSDLARAGSELKDRPLWIDDSGHLTIYELRGKARRLHSKEKLGLIVIDYLQLISGSDGKIPREQQIAEISRGVKALAKELDLPVIVLSQLNRDSEREGRDPRLSDLRESGSIEQDADGVFILHRPRKGRKGRHDTDNEPNREHTQPERIEPSHDVDKIHLIIAKQRNGPIGSVPLTFIRRYTRFENFVNESPQE